MIYPSLLLRWSLAVDLCLCIMYFNRTNWFLWLNGQRLTVPIGGTLWSLNFKHGSFLPPPLHMVKANKNRKLVIFPSLIQLAGGKWAVHSRSSFAYIFGPSKWSRNKRGRGWGISEEGSSAGEGVKAVEVGVREQKEGGVTGLQTRDKSSKQRRH